MKIFKNALPLIIICAANFLFIEKYIHAKGTKRKTTQSERQTPTQKPVEQSIQKPKESVTQVKNYKQLHNEVKNATDAWDNINKLLKDTFVTRISQNTAVNSDLEAFYLDSLLQTARDYHARFTGNAEQDRTILENLKQQREELIKYYYRND